MEYVKKILEELECIVCQKYMYQIIPMCNKGHSICKECKEQLNNCPLCKERYIDGVRNYSLEKIGEELLKPCANDDCNEIFDVEEIKIHKKNCKFNYDCPLVDYNECDWSGGYTDLLKHVLRHKKIELEKVRKKESQTKQSYALEEKLYFAYNEVFSVMKIKMFDKKYNTFIPIYHGPREKAKNFVMVIQSNHFTYTPPCTPVKDIDKPGEQSSAPILISNDYDSFENGSQHQMDIQFVKKESNATEKRYCSTPQYK